MGKTSFCTIEILRKRGREYNNTIRFDNENA